MSRGNDVSAQQFREKTDPNLLLLRGVDRVARVSNNVILVKTTGDERLTCVDDKGNQTQITVANEAEVLIGQRAKAVAASTGLDPKQEKKTKGIVGRRETKQKTVRDSIPDIPDSPHLSLPPEVELVAQASTKDANPNVEIDKLTEALTTLSAEDDISSLSRNLKDFFPKILKVDIENKRLKATNALLEEDIVKYKTALQRAGETRRKAGSDSTQTKKEYEFQDGDSSRRQQEEFVKMKRQLKKAIDANQAWNNYSNDQLKIHLKQLQANDETVKILQNKLKFTKAESSTTVKQLKARIAEVDSRIAELESHLKDSKDKLDEIQNENSIILVKNEQLENEQKKVRKLAKGLIKEKEDLQKEADFLKEKVEQLSSSYTKEDVTKTNEDKFNGTESDSSTNLSHPLRNVESAMDKECINKEKENPDSGLSTAACSPAGSNDGNTRTSEDTNDAISILQEQVQQFKEDFNREREDRERAFGELDLLKKELENTKLLLHQQSESIAKKKSKKVLPRFTGKHKSGKEKEKKKENDQGAAFSYLDPDEVTHLQRARPVTDERRINTYQEESEDDNHVYHVIDD